MVDLLVVDDEEYIREGIARGIPWERHGVAVCGTAAGGSEALALVEQFLPDIVVLDIRMPDMDGLELLAILHERYPSIRAIIVSGHDDFEYARRAVELQAFAYLLKPVDEAELVARVLEARAQVERQLGETERDEELRRCVRESLPLLRDAFLVELAAVGPADEARARERAVVLGIPLHGSHCVAVETILAAPHRAAGRPDDDVAHVALRGRGERLLRAVHPATHAFSRGRQIGFLAFAGSIDRPALLARCRELRAWANASLGVPLSVGVGRTRPGLSGASESDRDALEALEQRITMGRNEVIDAEALGQCARASTARRGFERLLRRLDDGTLAAAKAGDRGRLAAIAAEAADGFSASAAAEPDHVDRLVSLAAIFLGRLAHALDVEPEGPGGADLYTELRQPRSTTELSAFLRATLEHLSAAWERRQAGANGFLARKARELVDADPAGDSSLSAVAARLCVHPSYLSRIYKAATGESFLEHVIGARMNEARRLLKESNRRVHEVAEAVGYRDVNHFTRTFRRVVGVSPSEFRNLP